VSTGGSGSFKLDDLKLPEDMGGASDIHSGSLSGELPEFSSIGPGSALGGGMSGVMPETPAPERPERAAEITEEVPALVDEKQVSPAPAPAPAAWPQQAQTSPYTVMLAVAVLAMLIGCLCLLIELWSYGFKLKARTAHAISPPAVVQQCADPIGWQSLV
jgi:hypothetical protein